MKNNFELSDIFPSAKNQCEVQTLLDTDMYKVMMLDFILSHPEYSNLVVTWKMTVRSKDVKTAEIIPEKDLINQLEMTKNLPGISDEEFVFLQNHTLPNGRKALQDSTLQFLQTNPLSDYHIEKTADGNYDLEFTGTWAESMLWEIFGLKIINSLYLKNYILKDSLSSPEISKIVNTTLDRLYSDIEIFKQSPELRFSEFGSRRAMSAPFQQKVFEILQEEIPNQCIWTSNIHLSRLAGTKPIGTNAHELRMIPTALYDNPQKIIDTMYDIDRKWQQHFPGLGILLPDTYGTSFYYENCPKDILESHNGTRFDSKDPMEAIPEYVNWLLENDQDPQEKAWIPSDGLTSKNASEIQKQYKNSVGSLSFGIGTNLSNNTKGTYPREEKHGPFGSFSVVIKPAKVQRPDGTWVSCVKLSDNPEKAVWDVKRVQHFKEIFWVAGVKSQEVLV